MSHISIRVSTLRGDQKIEFDVFVKIADKMVHYLRRGDSFEGTRLNRFKEKKLKNLYILDTDEANYRKYLQTNIESAYDSKSTKDISTRAEIVQGDQQAKVEEVFEKPEDKVAYEGTKEASSKFVDFLSKNPQASSAVLKLENGDKNLAHHGVTVATFSIELAKSLGIVDPKQIQTITMGALLHDMGHHETKINYTLPIKSMTKDDLIIYRNHTKVGLEKIKNTQHFDPGVIKIISEHEECIDGSGFPNKLMENQLDPNSIIVATCNSMDRLLTFYGVPKADAPKQLMVESVGKYPLGHLKKLGEIVKATN